MMNRYSGHKEQSWIERNGRQYLKDILPLDMPLSVQIEPTSFCNFKCCYCYHSLEKAKQRPSEHLSMDIYKKFIEGSKRFPGKFKSFLFCGGGEPLLRKDIFQMVSLANDVADETVILTNGSLLKKDIVDKLIESGIKTVRISLQGLCSEDYFNLCGVKYDFDEFLENIEYLYENRGQMKLVLKMPDIAINTEEKRDLFYKLFENKCDILSIQTISPFVKNLDYTGIQNEKNQNLYGQAKTGILVCPQIFFTLIMTYDGKISPCSDIYYNTTSPIIGDITKNDLISIWNSEELRNLRISHLSGCRNDLESCKDCHHISPLNNAYDNIDSQRFEILGRYEAVR